MARHFVEAQHPRHKENGRFREKHGSDATAYAKRISAKIAASRGESGDGKPARRRPPAKKAPAARVEARPDRKAVKGEHERAYDKAISAGDSAAAMRAIEAANPGMSDGQKATARKRIADAIGSKTPRRSGGEVGKVQRYYASAGGGTKAEIDKVMHEKLKDYSVAELRAVIKQLAKDHQAKKSGSSANPSIGDSIARLIEKKTG